ncbi:hypothetical protein LCGC14_1350950 [marine sediment metagenome]|uniref:Uncharacterized protein n=2 Tax=marine sediment metagenome TaxID=412755 RepID=A0A0F9KBM4_9ZZZZ
MKVHVAVSVYDGVLDAVEVYAEAAPAAARAETWAREGDGHVAAQSDEKEVKIAGSGS